MDFTFFVPIPLPHQQWGMSASSCGVFSCQLELNLNTTLIWTCLWSQLAGLSSPGSKPTTEQRWLLPFSALSSHSGDQPCACHEGAGSDGGVGTSGSSWEGSAPQLAPWAELRAWERRDLGHPPALASLLALIYHQYRHSRAFFLMQQIIKKKPERKKTKNLLATTVKKKNKRGSSGEASMQPQTDKWSLLTEHWKFSWETGPWGG